MQALADFSHRLPLHGDDPGLSEIRFWWSRPLFIRDSAAMRLRSWSRSSLLRRQSNGRAAWLYRASNAVICSSSDR